MVILIPCKNWGCDDRHTNCDWYEDTAKRHWDRNDSAAVCLAFSKIQLSCPLCPRKPKRRMKYERLKCSRDGHVVQNVCVAVSCSGDLSQCRPRRGLRAGGRHDCGLSEGSGGRLTARDLFCFYGRDFGPVFGAGCAASLNNESFKFLSKRTLRLESLP